MHESIYSALFMVPKISMNLFKMFYLYNFEYMIKNLFLGEVRWANRATKVRHLKKIILF